RSPIRTAPVAASPAANSTAAPWRATPAWYRWAMMVACTGCWSGSVPDRGQAGETGPQASRPDRPAVAGAPRPGPAPGRHRDQPAGGAAGRAAVQRRADGAPGRRAGAGPPAERTAQRRPAAGAIERQRRDDGTREPPAQ